MKELLKNELYLDDIRYTADLPLPWEKLAGKTVVISGATGMIGRFLVDVLMEKNRRDGLACKVAALGRDPEKARTRFSHCWGRDGFSFIRWDIGGAAPVDVPGADYVFHLASNTHPLAYATDPIGTVAANVIGADRLLELAAERGAERFVFASSVEIYGENRGDTERFDEAYCGYIDCNTLRAGYPEAKRCGEALCQAYIRQKGLDVVVPRLARTLGPTMLSSDSKAISQFLKKGAAGEDIVLKSEGKQLYSYAYVADTVSGLLYCCLEGACGEAYNVVGEGADATLRDLANYIAEWAGSRVVFELPDATERAGYSTATKALLDGAKLRSLGWRARFDVRQAVERTLAML